VNRVTIRDMTAPASAELVGEALGTPSATAWVEQSRMGSTTLQLQRGDGCRPNQKRLPGAYFEQVFEQRRTAVFIEDQPPPGLQPAAAACDELGARRGQDVAQRGENEREAPPSLEIVRVGHRVVIAMRRRPLGACRVNRFGKEIDAVRHEVPALPADRRLGERGCAGNLNSSISGHSAASTRV